MMPTGKISQKGESAGSFQHDEPAFLVVGKLHRPHGLNGEIVMSVHTDFPERLNTGTTVFIGDDHHPLIIRSCRRHKNSLLMSFNELNSPEEIGIFRNQYVYVITTDRPPLEEGEYYHHQLLGLRVIDQAGSSLGYIDEILETGANDVLVIRDEVGKDYYLPYVNEMILQINLEEGFLKVDPIPGIFS